MEYRIWKNWRRKSADGVPLVMLFLWAAAHPPLGAYAIIQNFNVPVQVQPQVFIVLCMICWSQTAYYQRKWPVWKASLAGLGIAGILAALESVLIFGLRIPYKHGVSWPIDMLSIIATVMLAIGLLPPYWEIYKCKGRVVGLSMRFLTIDILGALFSLLALAVQKTWDMLGGISYIVALLLEFGIIGCHLVWLFRTRKTRQQAKNVGLSYDEYVQADNKEANQQRVSSETHDPSQDQEQQTQSDKEPQFYSVV
ncbi:hypothetical protein NA57DRAFT_70693 [Rhizodiscina lignyota]|uniref:PQ loop repeat protein n=1 Tax=Rhizodiscina lignyota TaxID=1504668 RepID=A0A9P4INR3_9PEZI|nr:hypothetical protein NA57DRAFT_70693 [Rhizodiscina lignyota]